MLPASNSGVGMNVGFPDVCLTPVGPSAVPIPYPNLALNAQATPFSMVVFVTKRPGLNMGSVIPLTSGDEAGVAHPIIKGPGTYTVGNPKVFVEKLPGINLTCPTKGNGVNNGLGMVAVPSIVNVFYSLATGVEEPSRADPYFREVDLKAALALDETLEDGLFSATLTSDGIGVLTLRSFSKTVPSQVWTALGDLSEHNVGASHPSAAPRNVFASHPSAAPRNVGASEPSATPRGMWALLIDLSGCPGGDTDAALRLAGDFVAEGTLLAICKDADGDETPHRSVTEKPFDWPMAILVDERTASAAEVFAGALTFHGRAALLGKKTFGKGAAQQVVAGADGAQFSQTVAELLLPDGSRIEGAGLSPSYPANTPLEALDTIRILFADRKRT